MFSTTWAYHITAINNIVFMKIYHSMTIITFNYHIFIFNVFFCNFQTTFQSSTNIAVRSQGFYDLTDLRKRFSFLFLCTHSYSSFLRKDRIFYPEGKTFLPSGNKFNCVTNTNFCSILPISCSCDKTKSARIQYLFVLCSDLPWC